jgi:hypothetical protein
MKLIKIPQMFFDDHRDRFLPTPEIIKESKTNYWIYANPNDPGYIDLVEDVEMYADIDGPDDCSWLKVPAKALLRAINKQTKETV